MLTRSPGFVSASIKKMILDIQTESARFDRELRSSHREKIVLPIEIVKGETVLKGFTRNISETGVCIISFEELEEASNYELKIYRLINDPSHVLAECRWSKTFGPRFWISGWQFVSMKRKR